MEALHPLETSVNLYRVTWYHIAEVNNTAPVTAARTQTQHSLSFSFYKSDYDCVIFPIPLFVNLFSSLSEGQSQISCVYGKWRLPSRYVQHYFAEHLTTVSK
jgi:hypothetical protein